MTVTANKDYVVPRLSCGMRVIVAGQHHSIRFSLHSGVEGCVLNDGACIFKCAGHLFAEPFCTRLTSTCMPFCAGILSRELVDQRFVGQVSLQNRGWLEVPFISDFGNSATYVYFLS